MWKRIGFYNLTTQRTEADVHKFLGAEVNALVPFINSKSHTERLRIASKMIATLLNVKSSDLDKKSAIERNSLIRLAEVISGQQPRPDPQVSITNTNAAPSVSRNPLPKPSTYESYSQCVNDLTSNYRASQNVAENYCKNVNADDNTTGPNTPSNATRKKSASVELPYYVKAYNYSLGESIDSLPPKEETYKKIFSAKSNAGGLRAAALQEHTIKKIIGPDNKPLTKQASVDDNIPYFLISGHSQRMTNSR